MPFTCVVPGCQGNYRSGPKVKVFSFPKDTELANKWIRAIKRENFTPTKNSKVCTLSRCIYLDVISSCMWLGNVDERLHEVLKVAI